VSIGWVGFGLSQGFWTVAILIIGAIIGIVTMFKNSDWAYGAVFIWAYAGILTKTFIRYGLEWTVAISTGCSIYCIANFNYDDI
jgi:hypothetical protein